MMPNVIGNNTLKEFWGYKYDAEHRSDRQASAGINVHADAASVNLNFWITPDDANLDKSSGGLQVWSKLHASSDDGETIRRLQSGDVAPEEKARFLGLSDADRQVVPYRENRAVIFRSSIYHRTDEHKFKAGFRNSRINYTLLFGWPEDVRCRAPPEAAGAAAGAA